MRASRLLLQSIFSRPAAAQPSLDYLGTVGDIDSLIGLLRAKRSRTLGALSRSLPPVVGSKTATTQLVGVDYCITSENNPLDKQSHCAGWSFWVAGGRFRGKPGVRVGRWCNLA